MENLYNLKCENKTYNILVVEDSKVFSNAISRSLKKDSHTITCAFTLQEAADFIQTQEFGGFDS